MSVRTLLSWGALAVLLVSQSAVAQDRMYTDAELQAFTDATAQFHGAPGQLSTVESITNIPNGIEVRATFRIGTGACDALFGCGPSDVEGMTFARITLMGTNFPGLNLTSFSSLSANVESSVDAFVQPFVQTDPNFTFYEQSDGGDGLGAGGSALIGLDFAAARNFAGVLPANEVHLDGNGMRLARQFGYQIVGNGVAVGQPVSAIIRITGVPAIPEPSAVALVGLALAGAGCYLRRR
jgi:hypothetical protein